MNVVPVVKMNASVFTHQREGIGASDQLPVAGPAPQGAAGVVQGRETSLFIRSVSSVTPGNTDVLCGRGGASNRHPGNQLYRRLIKNKRVKYALAEDLIEKKAIIHSVVLNVANQHPPGRFLIRSSSGHNGMPVWVEASELKIHDKVSQALREGAPEIRERYIGRRTIPNRRLRDELASKGLKIAALSCFQEKVLPEPHILPTSNSFDDSDNQKAPFPVETTNVEDEISSRVSEVASFRPIGESLLASTLSGVMGNSNLVSAAGLPGSFDKSKSSAPATFPSVGRSELSAFKAYSFSPPSLTRSSSLGLGLPSGEKKKKDRSPGDIHKPNLEEIEDMMNSISPVALSTAQSGGSFPFLASGSKKPYGSSFTDSSV